MDTLLRETVNAVVNSRFPEMSIEGRRQIESILIREEFPKGAIALKEGEVAHEIVFVGKGMLRQYYYKNGKDVTEHFSYEGCITMCIESFLKQVPTRLIVETLEPSIIYLFPRDMIQKLARENWEINMFYQKILEYSLIFKVAWIPSSLGIITSINNRWICCSLSTLIACSPSYAL